MDVTKFFEPVQKFVGYIVDRFALLLISGVVLASVLNLSVLELFMRYASYQWLVDQMSRIGIGRDNQQILGLVILLFTFVAVLEIHERILNLLNKLSPIQFGTRSYGGESTFYAFAPLMWRCYNKKLELHQLRNLFQLTAAKIGIESAAVSRKADIFDFVPAWIFLVIVVGLASPDKYLSAGFTDFLKVIALLIAVGFAWELYRGAGYIGELARNHYLAANLLISTRSYDFQPLTKEQENELAQMYADRREMDAGPWRLPLIHLPWVQFAREVIGSFRSEWRRMIRLFRKWRSARSSGP